MARISFPSRCRRRRSSSPSSIVATFSASRWATGSPPAYSLSHGAVTGHDGHAKIALEARRDLGGPQVGTREKEGVVAGRPACPDQIDDLPRRHTSDLRIVAVPHANTAADMD